MSTIREYGTRAYKKRIVDVVEAGLVINFLVRKRHTRLIADDGQDLTSALAYTLHIPYDMSKGGIRLGLDPEDSIKAFVFEIQKFLPSSTDVQWRMVKIKSPTRSPKW